jgi:hypothetical protein
MQKTISRRLMISNVTLTGQSHFKRIFEHRDLTLLNHIKSALRQNAVTPAALLDFTLLQTILKWLSGVSDSVKSSSGPAVIP